MEPGHETLHREKQADDQPVETDGVFIVIPAYRARASIRHVVDKALAFADRVIVVDDACPDRCSELVENYDERVTLVRHSANLGVGGATKTGIREALRMGAEFIVKVDSDDQMDVSFIPTMLHVLRTQPEVDLVKGNRFADPETIRTMPVERLIGNAGLTFFVKFSTGYWSVVDPTNGFIALRADAVAQSTLERLANRYFFEIDLLCWFGLRRRVIAEVEMPAIYAGAHSSLSIGRILLDFPGRLLVRYLQRLLINYVVVEINVGTLCAALGIPALLAGLIYGSLQWYQSAITHVPAATGVIVLALLLFTVGFQLTLQALLYDVQFATPTKKIRRDSHELRTMSRKDFLR